MADGMNAADLRQNRITIFISWKGRHISGGGPKCTRLSRSFFSESIYICTGRAHRHSSCNNYPQLEIVMNFVLLVPDRDLIRWVCDILCVCMVYAVVRRVHYVYDVSSLTCVVTRP